MAEGSEKGGGTPGEHTRSGVHTEEDPTQTIASSHIDDIILSWDTLRNLILPSLPSNNLPFWTSKLDAMGTALHTCFPDNEGMFTVKEVDAFVSDSTDGASFKSFYMPKESLRNTLASLTKQALHKFEQQNLIRGQDTTAPNPAQQQGGLGGQAQSWAVAQIVQPAVNFTVPFDNLAFPTLLKTVAQGGCFLVQGAYRSGKSSHIRALLDYFNSTSDYFAICVSLSYAGEPQDEPNKKVMDSVWNGLSPYIPKGVPSRSLQGALIAIAASAKSRKFVLLWDEFQILVGDDVGIVCSHISEAIRNLTQGADKYIHASVGFGTFSLQFLDAGKGTAVGNEAAAGVDEDMPGVDEDVSVVDEKVSAVDEKVLAKIKNMSPFHRKPALFMADFPPTAAVMRATIMRWCTQRKRVLDEEVIEAWIACSGGHLGIFSYIGYIMDCQVVSPMSYRQWTEVYSKIIKVMAGEGSGTFSRMIEVAKQVPQAARNLMRPFVLCGQHIVVSHDDVNYLPFVDMASAGIFTRTRGIKDTFSMSCPLVENLLIEYLVPLPSAVAFDPNLLLKESTRELVSWFADSLVPEQQTLLNPLCWKKKYFPTEVTFQNILHVNLKAAFRANRDMDLYLVLTETIQRQDMASLLRDDQLAIVSSHTQRVIADGFVLPVTAKDSKKRSDLLIINGNTVVIEIKVGVRLSAKRKRGNLLKLDKAVAQVASYAKQHALTTAILLNIVGAGSGASSVQESITADDGVTVYIFQVEFAPDFQTWRLINPLKTLSFAPINKK